MLIKKSRGKVIAAEGGKLRGGKSIGSNTRNSVEEKSIGKEKRKRESAEIIKNG